MHPRVETVPSPLRRASLGFAVAVCALCATATFAKAPPSTSTPDESAAAANHETQAPTSDDRAIVKIVRIEGTDAEAEAVAPRGMVAVRDTETGELRAPTAAEWSSLAASFDPLSRSAAGLEEIHYADGTIGVRLEGRFQSMSTIERADDGSLHAGCTHSAETVQRMVSDEPVDSAPSSAEEVSNVR